MDGKSNVLRHLGFQIRCKIEVLLVGEGQVREREKLTNCKGGFARSKNRGGRNQVHGALSSAKVAAREGESDGESRRQRGSSAMARVGDRERERVQWEGEYEREKSVKIIQNSPITTPWRRKRIHAPQVTQI